MLAGRELPTACKRCFVFSCISKNTGNAELKVSILYCKDSVSICSSRKAEYILAVSCLCGCDVSVTEAFELQGDEMEVE